VRGYKRGVLLYYIVIVTIFYSRPGIDLMNTGRLVVLVVVIIMAGMELRDVTLFFSRVGKCALSINDQKSMEVIVIHVAGS